MIIIINTGEWSWVTELQWVITNIIIIIIIIVVVVVVLVSPWYNRTG